MSTPGGYERQINRREVENFIRQLPHVGARYEADLLRQFAEGEQPKPDSLLHPASAVGTLGKHATVRVLSNIVANCTYFGAPIPPIIREKSFGILAMVKQRVENLANQDPALVEAFRTILNQTSRGTQQIIIQPPTELSAYLHALAQTKARYPDFAIVSEPSYHEPNKFFARQLFNPPDEIQKIQSAHGLVSPVALHGLLEQIFRYIALRGAELHSVHFRTTNQDVRPLTTSQAQALRLQINPQSTSHVLLGDQRIIFTENPNLKNVRVARRSTNADFGGLNLQDQTLISFAEAQKPGQPVSPKGLTTLVYSEFLDDIFSEIYALYTRSLSSEITLQDVVHLIKQTFSPSLKFGFSDLANIPLNKEDDLSHLDLPLGITLGFWQRVTNELPFSFLEYFGGEPDTRDFEDITSVLPDRPITESNIFSHADALETKEYLSEVYDIEVALTLRELPLLFQSQYPDEAHPYELKTDIGEPNLTIRTKNLQQFEFGGKTYVLFFAPRNSECVGLTLKTRDKHAPQVTIDIRREPRGDYSVVLDKPIEVIEIEAQFVVENKDQVGINVPIVASQAFAESMVWLHAGYHKIAGILSNLEGGGYSTSELEAALEDGFSYTYNSGLPTQKIMALDIPLPDATGRAPLQCSGTSLVVKQLLSRITPPDVVVDTRRCITLKRQEGNVVCGAHAVVEVFSERSDNEVGIIDATAIYRDDGSKDMSTIRVAIGGLQDLIAAFGQLFPRGTRTYPPAVVELCSWLNQNIRAGSLVNTDFLERVSYFKELWSQEPEDKIREYFGASTKAASVVVSIIQALERHIKLRLKFD